MGVFKEILHSLAGIWSDVKTIKQMQDPTLVEKAKRYEAMKRSLDNLRFEVTKVYTKINDEGVPTIYVEYGRQLHTIAVDVNGEATCDPFIVAMNELNLISYEDMVRISDEMKKQKEG